MVRNISGWVLAILGPWLVFLIFAHAIRPFEGGKIAELVTIILAYITGLSGYHLVRKSIGHWPLEWQLLCFVIYAAGLAVSVPTIGLLSVCSTGDCL
jgi:hypothetical protein